MAHLPLTPTLFYKDRASAEAGVSPLQVHHTYYQSDTKAPGFPKCP